MFFFQHVTAVLVDQSVYHDPDADDMEQTEETMSEANTRKWKVKGKGQSKLL